MFGDYTHEMANAEANEQIRNNVERRNLDELRALRENMRPLNDEQIYNALCGAGLLGTLGKIEDDVYLQIARVIEAEHGIKSNAELTGAPSAKGGTHDDR